MKRTLRARMNQSSAAIVLIGEKTKNLFKFVRWELELALDLDVPIIAAYLDEGRAMNPATCPAILRDEPVLHIPFKMAAIKFALDNWPGEYRRLSANDKSKGPRHYSADVYRSFGL